MPLKHLQLGDVEGLRAHADAIDAGFAEHLQVVERGCRGIHLDREFIHRRQIDPRPQAGDQPRHLIDRQQRRRAAAEEDCLEAERLRAGLTPQIEFAQDAVDKPRHSVWRLPCDRIEVAVMTFVKAERDMDVER